MMQKQLAELSSPCSTSTLKLDAKMEVRILGANFYIISRVTYPLTDRQFVKKKGTERHIDSFIPKGKRILDDNVCG